MAPKAPLLAMTRINKLHITLSLFLLSTILTGRVGMHIFHHHESSYVSKTESSSAVFVEYSETDCLLCKLDVFQEILINALLVFFFLLVFEKTDYQFLFLKLKQFLFFKNSRGPPFAIAVS
jgi:hypothetical protein